MDISISLPDEIARPMARRWRDLQRHTLEILVADAYRAGVITSAQVQALLEIPSRLEVDAFLKEAGAHLDYTEQDLDQDIEALRQLDAA